VQETGRLTKLWGQFYPEHNLVNLQYNVAGLLKEPVGATREYRVDAPLRPRDDAGPSDNVSGLAHLLRTPRGVLVTARLDGTLGDECSRCLKPVHEAIQLNIEEEFVQTVDIDTGSRLADADPDDFRIDVHHDLDLEDAVRQYWSAALPIQVLCRADCKGLCPRCGADLNVGSPHECDTIIDERWSALRALTSEKEGS
jgi:uncharacterized protein